MIKEDFYIKWIMFFVVKESPKKKKYHGFHKILSGKKNVFKIDKNHHY